MVPAAGILSHDDVCSRYAKCVMCSLGASAVSRYEVGCAIREYKVPSCTGQDRLLVTVA